LNWSDDGEYFASGSKDMTVRIWNLRPQQGFIPTTLSGHRDVVVAVFWVKGMQRLYSLARDGFIYTWGAKEGGEEKTSERPGEQRRRSR